MQKHLILKVLPFSIKCFFILIQGVMPVYENYNIIKFKSCIPKFAVCIKVHIFWEGLKILQNLLLPFDCTYCKIVWPSQNIWTLCGFMSNSHNKFLTVSICSYLIEVECKFNLIHSAHQFKVDSFDTLHLVRDTLCDFVFKI